MKKRNMTALALMGLASSFLVTGQISADEDRPESRTEENKEIARGGCGSNCGGGGYRSSPRDRRYGGNLSQRDMENPPSEGSSCGGQGSCHGQGNGRGSHCNGRTNDHSCQGNGHCQGYSNTQNMKSKRSNIIK